MALSGKKSNSFPIRLPTSMRQKVKELSKQEGISINHFICVALAEKIARLHQHQLNDDQRKSGTIGGSGSETPQIYRDRV